MDGSRPGSLTVAPASTGADAPVAVPAPLARAVRVRVRIVTALAVGFLAVAVIAAGAFTITVLGAADTTQSLLLDRNRRMVEAEIEFVRGRLDPVARQLEFVAALAGRGRLDTGDPGQIMDALASMVEHMPQISGAGFGGGDGTLHRLQRGTSSGKLRRDSAPLAGVPGAVERFNDLRKAPATYWGELLWNPVQRQPVVNVRTPILREDGTFLGGLVATVTVGDFSRMVTDAEGGGGDANFILVARERVLAHRGLTAGGTFIRTEARPLPRIDEVGDPVMAAIWTTPVRNRAFDSALGGLGHVVEVQGRRWVFVFRGLDGYGPDRWLVGRYFPLEDATREVQRLMQGVWAGIAVLAAALLLAAVMGVRMARDIRRLGAAAEAIERFEFEGPHAPPSRLKEIAEAGETLEKARSALKWFGAYVPRRLVRRLMEEGEGILVSKRRDVTVMFTDIVGFTPQAESMDEHGTADMLNQHFALLGAAIEREQGVVDKYIGDAVMAVWGGIKRMPDHADAACRAAIEIARIVRIDNAERRERGMAPIRLRVGLHSGPVIIGNIGAPERMNYTVVGDTVNVANRFEQLGKSHMRDDEEVIVLASGDTIAALQDPASIGVEPVFIGEEQVKGRVEPERVYRLA